MVSGHEGTRRRPAGNRVHHRRLHFQEAARIEEPAQLRQQSRAHGEARPRVFAHDEIEIALPVLDFRIREATVLLRQGAQCLGQQADRLRRHGQFAPVRPHQRSADSDDVADVIQLSEILVGRGTNVVAAQVALHAPTAVLQRDETRPAHDPAQHDASGDRHGYGLLFECRLVRGRVRFVQFRRQRRPRESARVGQATFSQSRQFIAADRQDVAFFGH